MMENLTFILHPWSKHPIRMGHRPVSLSNTYYKSKMKYECHLHIDFK